ncbi:MAG: hypothetical protein WC464_03645 [Bdellovibrionales bacterium]
MINAPKKAGAIAAQLMYGALEAMRTLPEDGNGSISSSTVAMNFFANEAKTTLIPRKPANEPSEVQGDVRSLIGGPKLKARKFVDYIS